MLAVAREAPPNEKPYELWLAIFLVALVALRLIANALARTDLVFDEAQYWSWSRELDFGYFSKPPLLAWTIAMAEHVCGSSEACVRAPAPVLYLGTSLLVYAVARQFYDEAQYWAWSRDLALGYYTKPPLLAWIIAAATHVCGDAEWCVRAP